MKLYGTPGSPYARMAPATRSTRRDAFLTSCATAEAVRALPYGRVSDRDDVAAVLKEGKGTCSGKHRFLAALAHECGRTEVKLMLGLYEMSEDNTPGVGAALGTLGAVPEIHCYLAVGTGRFDFTGLAAGVASPFDSLIEERVVSPAELASAKPAWHRRAVEAWARTRRLSPDASGRCGSDASRF